MPENYRYLSNIISEFCFDSHKMAFISGPRQVGKTTLSKALLKERQYGVYHNWDDQSFRRTWTKEPKSILSPFTSSSQTPLIIFDEIHKAKLWKRTLKGVFDTIEHPTDIIVTGSAHLNSYQKGGDSLMGRYFPFRLHPLSVAELQNTIPHTSQHCMHVIEQGAFELHAYAQAILDNLIEFSGFPEPFTGQHKQKAQAWRTTRTQQVIREDLRDLSRLPELSQIEMLVALLPERVAQPLSRTALREDLEVAYTTVTRWLTYLESLYYFFEIKPYSKKIRRTLKKEGKLFLWDYADPYITPGARFENCIASHLLKACHYWTDSGEGEFQLHYLRNRDNHELDFLITKNREPWLPIEVKTNDTNISPAWNTFMPQLPCKIGLQLVHQDGIKRSIKLDTEKTIWVVSAHAILREMV